MSFRALDGTAVILGCGYVGAALANRLVEAGRPVVVTRRSWAALEPLTRLDGVRGVVFDPAADDPARLADALSGLPSFDLWCLLTPQALGETASRRSLFGTLAQLPLAAAVLSSSTGIYGPVTAGEVDLDTPPNLASPREQRLADIERDWLHLPHPRVVRLAGLYGPGRVIGAGTLREGAVLPGAGTAWLNLIHRDDAAEILLRVAHHPAARAIELGTDGTPLTRHTYYAYLAGLLGTAAPRFESESEGDPGKRIDPADTARRLGFTPRHADFRAGLRASLAAGG